MALIDLNKFVASFITEIKKNHMVITYNIPSCIKKALEDQGLEYKGGEIVKSQRRVSAEAKENGYGESEDEKIKKFLISFIKMESGVNLSHDDAGKILVWLEKQSDKDKLIKKLGEYKVKYTQEVLEKYINSMRNKDDKRLRKTTIAFLKDFAEQGYENAVECIDWLEKQGEQKSKWGDDDENSNVNDETNTPTGYGKYVDECLNEASKHFFSEGEDTYSVADLFYAGVRCGKSWLEKQGSEPNWCHHKVDLSNCSEEYRKAYYDGWNNCNMQHSQCESEGKNVVDGICISNGAECGATIESSAGMLFLQRNTLDVGDKVKIIIVRED